MLLVWCAEAVFFKKRLTKEVYPELHKYLREREFAVVAHNLQSTWDEVIPALALRAPRPMSSTANYNLLLLLVLFIIHYYSY
jgi:hypothetical protein